MAISYIERLTFENANQEIEEYDIHDKRVDALSIPSKISDLQNDSHFIEDSNYVHTDNNYSTAEKQKVTEIDNKVDKIKGKGLSSNDLTDELLEKISGNAASSHSHANKSVLDAVSAAYTEEKDSNLSQTVLKVNNLYNKFGIDLEKPKMFITNPSDKNQSTNIDWENIQISKLTDYTLITPTSIQSTDTSGASFTINKSGIAVIGKIEKPSISLSKLNSSVKTELNPGEIVLTNLQGTTITINANSGVSLADSANKDGEGNNIKNTYTTKQELQEALDGMEGSASAITNKINSFNHNCFYRGADITSYLTDNSLWDRIAGINGHTEFEDLYLGDYITLGNNITASGSTREGTNKVVIAGFNLYKYIEGNHLVMLPDTDFGAAAMGASSSGYKGTNLHQEILNGTSASINTQLETIFTTHLKSYSTKLVNSLDDSGLPASTEAVDLKTILLNEIEITGSRIWGANGHNIGNENIKLPIFNFTSPFGSNYWLRDIIKEDNYCNTSYNGEISSKVATEESGIKAKFIIG